MRTIRKKSLTQRINGILYSVGGSRYELEKQFNAPYFDHSVWVTDLTFNVIWMNDYFLDTYGYSETEFASGENFAKVFKDLNPQEPNFFAYVSQTLPKEFVVHCKDILTMTGEKKNVTYKFSRLDSIFNIIPLFYIIQVFDHKPEKWSTGTQQDTTQTLNENTIMKESVDENVDYQKKKLRKMSISHLVDDSSPRSDQKIFK